MKLEIKVPNYVREIQKKLNEYGYECYIVGGAILWSEIRKKLRRVKSVNDDSQKRR